MLHQHATTIASELRDFPEWHHGREHYAVWLLNCESNGVIQEKFKAARAHICDYIYGEYNRQPHITVFVCGFLSDTLKYNDDCLQAHVDTQIDILKQSGMSHFDIEIGGINSFASAPYLEVIDSENGISQLRNILQQGGTEFRTAPYRPHMTIGLYAAEFSSKMILAKMAEFSYEVIKWRVKTLTLATYRATEVVGPLYSRYIYHLKC